MGLINADGSGYTTFVPGGWPDFEIEGPPIWSPNSAHVTYPASGATFVVDVAGGPERRLNDYPPPSDWQPLPVNTPSSFPTPHHGGTSHLRIPRTRALAVHSTDTTHGAPLSFSACSQPVPTSDTLTIGTPQCERPARELTRLHRAKRSRRSPRPARTNSDIRIDSRACGTVSRASTCSNFASETQGRARPFTSPTAGTASPGP